MMEMRVMMRMMNLIGGKFHRFLYSSHIVKFFASALNAGTENRNAGILHSAFFTVHCCAGMVMVFPRFNVECRM